MKSGENAGRLECIRKNGCGLVELSAAAGWKRVGEVAAEAQFCSGFVQCDLGKEELMFRVGLGVEADYDLRPRDRVAYAVVKRVAEFL